MGIVISGVLPQHATQVGGVEDDLVVEAFAPDRADEASAFASAVVRTPAPAGADGGGRYKAPTRVPWLT
jgi:hypothetical protein